MPDQRTRVHIIDHRGIAARLKVKGTFAHQGLWAPNKFCKQNAESFNEVKDINLTRDFTKSQHEHRHHQHTNADNLHTND